MCDFSLHHVNSRPAKVGDRLTTHDFRTGTRGFAASEDANMAVCLLPGTELSFASEVACSRGSPFSWRNRVIHHRTAIFRQINKSTAAAHHDALEFPDGEIALITLLKLRYKSIVKAFQCSELNGTGSDTRRGKVAL